MIKSIALIIIIAFRIGYHPSDATKIAPFASPAPPPPTTVTVNPATIISIHGSISNNKVILNWVIGQNETADQFEVEKSTDGSTFTLAALVFGTDKPENGNYQFYEKASKQKISYRIKIINKNRATEYSPVIEINPNV